MDPPSHFGPYMYDVHINKCVCQPHLPSHSISCWVGGVPSHYSKIAIARMGYCRWRCMRACVRPLLFRYYVINISLLFRYYFFIISLLFHYYFVIISLLCRYYFSLLFHYCFVIISLLFRYYFVIISLVFRFYFIIIISLMFRYYWSPVKYRRDL